MASDGQQRMVVAMECPQCGSLAPMPDEFQELQLRAREVCAAVKSATDHGPWIRSDAHGKEWIDGALERLRNVAVVFEQSELEDRLGEQLNTCRERNA